LIDLREIWKWYVLNVDCFQKITMSLFSIYWIFHQRERGGNNEKKGKISLVLHILFIFTFLSRKEKIHRPTVYRFLSVFLCYFISLPNKRNKVFLLNFSFTNFSFHKVTQTKHSVKLVKFSSYLHDSPVKFICNWLLSKEKIKWYLVRKKKNISKLLLELIVNK
jgi:hypothetical protein